MKYKQTKTKFSAVILVICLILANSPLMSYAYYTAGPSTFSAGNIALSANTEKTMEFYLPFDSSSFTFDYASENGFSLTIDTGSRENTVSFLPTGTSGTFAFTAAERSGEKAFKIKASESVTLTNVVFVKHQHLSTSINVPAEGYITLSENEELLQRTVLINKNASAIIVNGGKRYINNQSETERPIISDNSIFLPARTLALALGYYYENIPSSNYIFLRNTETATEFYFSAKASYVQKNNGTKEPLKIIPIYKNGKPYLPVRYFAEALGKTVGYRDGIVIIDDKYTVSKAIENDAVFNYIKEQFEDFTKEPEKGTTYHVAKNGKNTNSGTEDKPFLTLAKAGAVAEAGDTVIIHAGTYRETLAPVNDGTATSPIVFKAAENEKVIISALNEVTGFKDAGSGLVSADFSWNLGDGRNQMFIDGVCIPEARYPNGPALPVSTNTTPISDLFPVRGDFKVNDDNPSLVESSTLLQEETVPDFSGATYVSMHGYAWTLSTAKIASTEKGKIHLSTLSREWWYNPATSSQVDYGYISGHKNAIDLPGEWAIDEGKIIMKPLNGEAASQVKVEMKKRQVVIDLADRKYVKIKGINTIGGGARLNNSVMCTLDGMNMKYISHYVFSDDQREGFIDEYTVDARKTYGSTGAPSRGEVGLYIGGSDNAVINSVIDHSAASALYLTGTYAYIDNNEITNCGYMGSYVSGITAYTEPWKPYNTKRGGFFIYNNTVCNAGRSLFVVQGNEGIFSYFVPFLPFEVAYNDFHDGIMFSLDTGITYEYGVLCATDKLWSKIHDNYVYYTLTETNPYSFGIYNDGNSLGMNCYNNVVFTTEPGTTYTSDYVYSNASLSSSTLSNNSAITKPLGGGPDKLTAQQFPSNKPFYAGALKGAENFDKNLARLDETINYLPASSGAVADGASIDSNGRLNFTAADQTSTYTNLDFGSNGYNKATVYYTGDRYQMADFVTFEFTNAAGEKDIRQIALESRSFGLDSINSTTFDMYTKSGKWDMKITSVRPKSSKLLGFTFGTDGNYTIAGHDGTHVVAGKYDTIIKMGIGGGNLYTTVVGSGDTSYVRNTYNGSTLLYRNVKIEDTANVLSLQLNTSSSYQPQTVTLYINSMDNEPLVVTKGLNTGFSDYTTTYAELNTPLAPGTYDVYIKVTGGSTSNFFSFGLLPSEPVQ